MEIIEIDREDIGRIKGLWESLNAHHARKSRYFRDRFEALTFERRFDRLLAKEHLVIYAASKGPELVGYCVATESESRGEIDSLYIREEYRGRDLGRKLTEKALSWLEQFECDEVILYVAEGNESVLPFYEKLGFRERYRVLQIR
jgi:diamine N-acetyltransferase